MKRKKTIIMLCIILGVFVVSMIFLFPMIQHIIKYNNGQKSLAEGDYISAIEAFEDIQGYKDANDKAIEARSKQSLEYIMTGDYEQAVSFSKDLLHEEKYKDTAVETIFEAAKGYYKESNLSKASSTIELISDFSNDNSEINQLRADISFFNNIQGTWHEATNKLPIVIEGMNLTYASTNRGKIYWTPETNEMTTEIPATGYKDAFYLIGDKIVHRLWVRSFDGRDYIEVEYAKKDVYSPKIGMTKDEVLKSIWGEPEKVNKTTTANGVHEQWVYSGNRYLYFNNGILTSIQE